MKSKILSLGLILGFVSTAALAQENADQPRHAKRFDNQKERIRNGLASGELTAKEARALRDDQRDLRAKVRELKADGELSAEDKKQIEAKQDVASSKIKVKKLNPNSTDGLSEERIRQFNQRQRIKDGLANGSLNHEEAKSLRAYIKSNAEVIKAANADGVVTGEEAAFIEARQDLSSDKIYLQRHDDETRAPASVSPAATAGTEK